MKSKFSCRYHLAAVLLAAVPAAGAADSYTRAADNHIYAQTVVNELRLKHPVLYWTGIHAPPPGATDYIIVASTQNLVGKKSDPNDMDIGRLGVSLITPNARLAKCGVMLPLKDASGKIIGALGMAFHYHDGDDQAEIYRQATLIRDEAARMIPNLQSLFGPVR